MSIHNLVQGIKETFTFKLHHSSSISALEQKKQINQIVKFGAYSMVFLIALEPSLAAAGTGGTGGTATTTAGSLETMATNIVGALTGGFGKAIATIAIMVLGIMAMFGKLAWDTAIKVIIGIAVTFGAASMVTWLTGGTTFDTIS
jgi:type IV secretory pathway VirB2 component (pilin)